LGRQAKSYLNRSKALSTRISTVIEQNLRETGKSAIARHWAGKKHWDIEYAFSILEAFQKGLRS
jgi:hypothetical protein